jgi:MFS family permease
MLYVLVSLYGGFGMPLYSLSVALANDHFEPSEMVRAAGAIVIYYGIGSVVGPLIGSQFMRWFGPTGLFVSMAIVQGLLIAFVSLQMPFIRSLPTRTSRFRVYPRMSPSAFQMLRKGRGRRRHATPGAAASSSQEQHGPQGEGTPR